MAHIKQTNLKVLAQKGYTLQTLPPPLQFNFEESRDGLTFPKGWYSRYNPKGVSKTLANTTKAGTILALGLGCGYQLEPFLTNPQIKKIIIIELMPALVTAILEKINLEPLLLNPKVQWFLTAKVEKAIDFCQQNYQPVVDGNLEIVPFRPVVSLNQPLYHQFYTAFNHYITNLTGDLSSQAYFAKKWFTNTIKNLMFYRGNATFNTVKKAMVVGSGPSLEHHIHTIKTLQHQGYCLIAVDAALLILQGYNLKADLSLTMDAQIYTHYHFLGIKQATLFSDLSASPYLASTYKAYFFAGNYPLAQLTPLNRLPTGSGNVGSVAYLLAKALGASHIKTFGLDFCYLKGKPYAKGVYLYQFFHQQSSRLNPSESQSVALMFRHQPLNKTYNKTGTINYQPSLFSFYQNQHQLAVQQTVQAWQPVTFNGGQFLQNYKNSLNKLLVSTLYNPSTVEQKNLVTTLMPVANYFYKHKSTNPIEESYQWSVETLQKLGV